MPELGFRLGSSPLRASVASSADWADDPPSPKSMGRWDDVGDTKLYTNARPPKEGFPLKLGEKPSLI